MTVTYRIESSGVTTFLKVLFRWRGSVYKVIWKELFIYLLLYTFLRLLHDHALNSAQKTVFVSIGRYCSKVADYIPLSFILGFYVTIIFNRWWGQFQAIAWPDSATLFACCYILGKDQRTREMRRTIARYLSLSAVLGLRGGSTAIKKRFPTMQDLIKQGFMTEEELKAYEAVPTKYAKQWVPCQWAMNICVRAKQEGKIENDYKLVEMIKAINSFRLLVRDTAFYDWMSVPLIYTQVVTVAVYSFFATCLMGRQHVSSDESYIYAPYFTILQFIFYVGWLKVAQCMINPHGEDDDDFEMNFMIDRNLETGYIFADGLYDEVPPLGPGLTWPNREAKDMEPGARSLSSLPPEFIRFTGLGLELPKLILESQPSALRDTDIAETNFGPPMIGSFGSSDQLPGLERHHSSFLRGPMATYKRKVSLTDKPDDHYESDAQSQARRSMKATAEESSAFRSKAAAKPDDHYESDAQSQGRRSIRETMEDASSLRSKLSNAFQRRRPSAGSNNDASICSGYVSSTGSTVGRDSGSQKNVLKGESVLQENEVVPDSVSGLRIPSNEPSARRGKAGAVYPLEVRPEVLNNANQNTV